MKYVKEYHKLTYTPLKWSVIKKSEIKCYIAYIFSCLHPFSHTFSDVDILFCIEIAQSLTWAKKGQREYCLICWLAVFILLGS